MKKIASSALIVSLQLIVGGLFLFMLFGSTDESDARIVVVDNGSLNKMADSVSELFVEEKEEIVEVVDKHKVEELSGAIEVNSEDVVQNLDSIEGESENNDSVVDDEKADATEEVVTEVVSQKLEFVDTSGYKSVPDLGFNVTTDNKIYELTEEEFGILAAVVSCEAKKTSKDDVLAVMSVILNRADSSRYPNNPISVVSAPHQFECYKRISIVPNELVEGVMRDALNGVRNNGYYGFRSWQTTSYSNNYIVDGGNRYS